LSKFDKMLYKKNRSGWSNLAEYFDTIPYRIKAFGIIKKAKYLFGRYRSLNMLPI